MKYSIVIPYHSNYQMLMSCLESLFSSTPQDTEIIVVANNSRKNEVDITLPGRARLIRHYENLFYPKAINIGANLATGEYLILSDADIYYRAGWLEALTTSLLAAPDIGGCSAKMLSPYDAAIKEYGIGATQFNFPHPFAGRHENFELSMRDMEVQAFCSAVSLYRRDDFLKAGGMSELLVDGYSDIDLCIRLHEMGFRTYVSANAVVYHHGSSTKNSGMSSSLRTDTKGVFSSRNGGRFKIDMDKYYSMSFENIDFAISDRYYLVDMTTVGDKQWHHNLFSGLGNIKWDDIYYHASDERDASHIDLYRLLDDNIRRLRCPILYFADRFTALRDNCLWADMRDCSHDLIIDRNANILEAKEVLCV